MGQSKEQKKLSEEPKKEMSNRSQKVIGVFAMVIFVAVVGVLCALAIPIIKMASHPEEFREWIDSMGIWGWGAYIGLVILQILVAFIPGEPLETVAGYAFGTVEGTILCLVAASLGSVMVLLLVRKFGVKLMEIFFSKEKIESLKFLHGSPKRTLIFTILFVLPGTPKDLLCYFAGLTDIKLWILFIICSVGRFPSIITSTLLGDALGTKNYWSAIIVVAATLVLSGIGVLIYKCIGNKKDEQAGSEALEVKEEVEK